MAKQKSQEHHKAPEQKSDDLKIMTILPAYNEEGKIGEMVKKTLPYCKDVVVVDDCSKDNTNIEAKEAGAVVLRHEVNKGVGAGIRTAIDYAIDNNYDVCVVMGGDCQDDPGEMHKHLAKIREGWDLVQGSRYIEEDTKDYPLFRIVTTKLFTWFFQLSTFSRACTDASNGYRAFKVNWVRTLDLWRDDINNYELEPYMLIQAIRQKKYTEVPVKKFYPKNKSYSKMKPFVSWYRISRPLFKQYFHRKRRENTRMDR